MSPAPYTVLRLSAPGRVTLRAGHLARLTAGARGAELARRTRAFDAFVQRAPPGIHRVWWREGRLSSEPRPASALQPGQPVRLLASPLPPGDGVRPKRPSPNPYDAVREAGTLTLLTDSGGARLQEACVAALVAWDGEAVVLVPDDTPRSLSLAEQAIGAELAHRRGPLRVGADWAIAAVNAVAGPFDLVLPGRRRFPAEVLRAMARALER